MASWPVQWPPCRAKSQKGRCSQVILLDFHNENRVMPDDEVMSKRRFRSSEPATPLTRPRPRLGHVAVPQLSARLRDLLEEHLSETSLLPATEELYALLVFAERSSRRISDTSLRAEAAIHRVMLWQWLREQIDAHQLRAVDDARDAGVEWAQLVRPLGVESVPGAHNKVRRMRAEQAVGADGSPVRRTPAAVTAALAARAAEEAQARTQASAALAHSGRILAAARLLHAHVGDLLTDDDDGDIEYWINEMDAVLTDVEEAGFPTSAQVASLAVCLSRSSSQIQRLAEARGHPTARTSQAAAAVEIASSITWE